MGAFKANALCHDRGADRASDQDGLLAGCYFVDGLPTGLRDILDGQAGASFW
jgi:hypothetical protein